MNPIRFDWSKPFWTDPKRFGPIKNKHKDKYKVFWTRSKWFEQTKTNWIRPKQIELIKKKLDL
jgi:hypothetical protein